jgi:hypothetical protein
VRGQSSPLPFVHQFSSEDGDPKSVNPFHRLNRVVDEAIRQVGDWRNELRPYTYLDVCITGLYLRKDI